MEFSEVSKILQDFFATALKRGVMLS